jgi:hypothetical protein
MTINYQVDATSLWSNWRINKPAHSDRRKHDMGVNIAPAVKRGIAVHHFGHRSLEMEQNTHIIISAIPTL